MRRVSLLRRDYGPGGVVAWSRPPAASSQALPGLTQRMMVECTAITMVRTLRNHK
jgi:hypothetical protein